MACMRDGPSGACKTHNNKRHCPNPKGPKDPDMESEIVIMILGTYLLFGSLDP